MDYGKQPRQNARLSLAGLSCTCSRCNNTHNNLLCPDLDQSALFSHQRRQILRPLQLEYELEEHKLPVNQSHFLNIRIPITRGYLFLGLTKVMNLTLQC